MQTVNDACIVPPDGQDKPSHVFTVCRLSRTSHLRRLPCQMGAGCIVCYVLGKHLLQRMHQCRGLPICCKCCQRKRDGLSVVFANKIACLTAPQVVRPFSTFKDSDLQMVQDCAEHCMYAAPPYRLAWLEMYHAPLVVTKTLTGTRALAPPKPSCLRVAATCWPSPAATPWCMSDCAADVMFMTLPALPVQITEASCACNPHMITRCVAAAKAAR